MSYLPCQNISAYGCQNVSTRQCYARFIETLAACFNMGVNVKTFEHTAALMFRQGIGMLSLWLYLHNLTPRLPLQEGPTRPTFLPLRDQKFLQSVVHWAILCRMGTSWPGTSWLASQEYVLLNQQLDLLDRYPTLEDISDTCFWIFIAFENHSKKWGDCLYLWGFCVKKFVKTPQFVLNLRR